MNESNKKDREQVSHILLILLATLSLVLCIWGAFYYWQSSQNRKQLEAGYRRAVQEAAVELSNISTDLVKGLYSGTPAQLAQVSSRLWKEASSAKSALSVLPLAELHLDKSHAFLSQVGEYAMALSRKTLKGETITITEREQLLHLREYAQRFASAVEQLNQELEQGELSFDQIQDAIRKGQSSSLDDALPTLVTNSSLDAMEEGFSGYPSLIYDGPFSDHILDKTPQITKTEALISVDEAKHIAEQAANCTLPYRREEQSSLPCWVFYSDDCSVAVSKNGGRICYLICSEKTEETRESEHTLSLSPQEAIAIAQKLLKSLGYSSMKDSYYEIKNDHITINFAQQQEHILCYTDLIKVCLSIKDGSLASLDARGWLVNHYQRRWAEPSLSATQAQNNLSPLLTVLRSRLVVIPTEGKQERLCWEFDCDGSAGDHVLVYINAYSGQEEQILLVVDGENGSLTK